MWVGATRTFGAATFRRFGVHFAEAKSIPGVFWALLVVRRGQEAKKFFLGPVFRSSKAKFCFWARTTLMIAGIIPGTINSCCFGRCLVVLHSSNDYFDDRSERYVSPVYLLVPSLL